MARIPGPLGRDIMTDLSAPAHSSFGNPFPSRLRRLSGPQGPEEAEGELGEHVVLWHVRRHGFRRCSSYVQARHQVSPPPPAPIQSLASVLLTLGIVSAHRARTAQHSNLGHGRGEKASGSLGRRMAVQALAKLGPPERRVDRPTLHRVPSTMQRFHLSPARQLVRICFLS